MASGAARMPTGESPVKRGGRRTPQGFLFELTGGAACLDLVNTLDERPLATRRDNLESYADLVDWAEQSRLLSPGEARALRRAAARRPAAAQRALQQMQSLREVLFALFSALARGRPAPAGPLHSLNRSLARAFAHLELVPGRPRFGSSFACEPGDLERLHFPVMQSAYELLTSAADLERLRVCAADACDWLFLDRSRNRSRRWCDMSVCGNRDKVKRFYHRRRE
ncbi:MAG: hypothetical protein EYC70_05470 [Planctomycetota bacterium]|nr:MAG: hypothetical protein EYC70_05470 [Planctomycetota bacterium]